MTTQTLSEAGQKLADALRQARVLHSWNHVSTAALNTAAALLFTPPEGEGAGLRVVFDGPPGPTSCCFVEVEDDNGKSVNVGPWREREDGFWELRISAPAALASPQPAVQGPVAAGVRDGPVEKAVWAASRFLEHLERIAYRDGAGLRLAPGHVLFDSLQDRVNEAKATLTPPADPKTPDAGVGGDLFVIDWFRSLFADPLWKAKHWQDDVVKAVGCLLLAQPAPVGEDETGVREAVIELIWNEYGPKYGGGPFATGGRVDWGYRASRPGDLLRATDLADRILALAPQPPKAETPAGVVLDGLTLEQLIHNYGAAEYNAAVDANEGAEPEHYEQKIAEAKAKLMQGIAALSTAPAARPGDGVERLAEPTQAMVEAGMDALMDAARDDVLRYEHCRAYLIAALAAAPVADGGRA